MGMHVILTWPKPEYSLLKQYFNVCALIFYMCEGLSQVILGARSFIHVENMQKNFGINIFDYEGIRLSKSKREPRPSETRYTSVVNFFKILRSTLMRAMPKSAKRFICFWDLRKSS